MSAAIFQVQAFHTASQWNLSKVVIDNDSEIILILSVDISGKKLPNEWKKSIVVPVAR